VKFFFGLLAFIAAVIVVILLVLSLFRGLESPNGDTGSLITSSYSLDDKTAVDSVARYTISGPIVAEENYRQVRITISKNVRTVEVLKGYKGTVDKTSTLPNTPESYTAFLGALRAAKFANKRETSDTDLSSICVTGNKYFYDLSLSGEKKVDTWATSCSNKSGTFAGNKDATAQLFRSQVPTYQETINGVNLSTL